MGQVPKNWCVRRLSDVAEVGSGIAINRSRTKSNAVELPYLRVANVQDGYLDLSEIKTLEIEASKVDRYLLEPGDVLMTEGGDYDKLGRGTVWEGQVQPCVHQNHIFRVRTSDDKLRPRFLSVITGSDYGKRYFLRNSKQTTNLATINKSQLRDFPVPLPSPLEQDRIIERIATQEEQIDSNTRYKRKLQSLKAGLMQDLLTGRVRVPEAEDRVDEVIA
jgi:type I restriction enzyme S subunit